MYGLLFLTRLYSHIDIIKSQRLLVNLTLLLTLIGKIALGSALSASCLLRILAIDF